MNSVSLIVCSLLATTILSISTPAAHAQGERTRTVTQEMFTRVGVPGRVLLTHRFNDGISLGYLVQDFVSSERSLSFYRYDFKAAQNTRLATSPAELVPSPQDARQAVADASERHLLWQRNQQSVYHVDLERGTVTPLSCGLERLEEISVQLLPDESSILLRCRRDSGMTEIARRIRLSDGAVTRELEYDRYLGYDASRDVIYAQVSEDPDARTQTSKLVTIETASGRRQTVADIGLTYGPYSVDYVFSPDLGSVVTNQREEAGDRWGYRVRWWAIDGKASTTLAAPGAGGLPCSDRAASLAFLTEDAIVCRDDRERQQFARVERPTEREQAPRSSTFFKPEAEHVALREVVSIAPRYLEIGWRNCTDKSCGKGEDRSQAYVLGRQAEYASSCSGAGSAGRLLDIRSKSTRWMACSEGKTSLRTWKDGLGYELASAVYPWSDPVRAYPDTEWVAYTVKSNEYDYYGRVYSVVFADLQAKRPRAIRVDWPSDDNPYVFGDVVGDGRWLVLVRGDGLYVLESIPKR